MKTYTKEVVYCDNDIPCVDYQTAKLMNKSAKMLKKATTAAIISIGLAAVVLYKLYKNNKNTNKIVITATKYTTTEGEQ